MIQIFKWWIATEKEINDLYIREMNRWIKELEAEEAPVLNCGAKSCQFQAKNEHGLAIHRAKAHK